MSANATQEIMTGIPEQLNVAWKRSDKKQRIAGFRRAWQLAKRNPEFWTKFGPANIVDSELKTTRIRMPKEVHSYIIKTKKEIAVPVSHAVSALLFLAFTDLSNPIYDREFSETVGSINRTGSQAA